jgi:hypothetical protein
VPYAVNGNETAVGHRLGQRAARGGTPHERVLVSATHCPA